jgi:hypothetical protein
MLIDKQFELEIPTHIAFTLYKNDYVDNLIISKVKKECRNESGNDTAFIVSLDQFQSAIKTSAFLRAEIKKVIDQDLLPNEKIFSRLIKVGDGREIVSFHFNIIEGTFDLTKILNRVQLDALNKKFMDLGIMKNKYLERTSYFYIKAVTLFDILAEMEESQILDAFDIIATVDPKIEEDNPTLLVKTDYTPY